jgi:hypothetical protein
MKSPAKSSLTEPRRRLVEDMQVLGFGKYEQLPVRNGNPVLHPRPRVVKEVKLGGEYEARPAQPGTDFLLKKQVVELFEHFDRLGTGTVLLLEVRHGLPFRFLIAEAVR